MNYDFAGRPNILPKTIIAINRCNDLTKNYTKNTLDTQKMLLYSGFFALALGQFGDDLLAAEPAQGIKI